MPTALIEYTGKGGTKYLGALTTACDREGDRARHGVSRAFHVLDPMRVTCKLSRGSKDDVSRVRHGQASPPPHPNSPVSCLRCETPAAEATKVCARTHCLCAPIPPGLISPPPSAKPCCNTQPLCPPQIPSSPRLCSKDPTPSYRRIRQTSSNVGRGTSVVV